MCVPPSHQPPMPNADICFNRDEGSKLVSGRNRGTSTESLTCAFLVSFGGLTSRTVHPSSMYCLRSLGITFLTRPSRICKGICPVYHGFQTMKAWDDHVLQGFELTQEDKLVYLGFQASLCCEHLFILIHLGVSSDVGAAGLGRRPDWLADGPCSSILANRELYKNTGIPMISIQVFEDPLACIHGLPSQHCF